MKKKIYTILLLGSGAYLLFTSYYLPVTEVFAQSSPDFLVSWHASDFVPADYHGKALPSKSTNVEIGFDLIDGGKIVDLSKNTVSWYLGNNQVDSGVGLKTLAAAIPTGLDQAIRITILNYKGGNNLDFAFLIPVSGPKIVLNTKTPTLTSNNQRFLPLKSYTFEARPFFFNVKNLSDLAFRWQVNNQPVEGSAENPDFLSLNLDAQGTPKESQFTVSAAAANNANQLEFGSKSLNFIVK